MVVHLIPVIKFNERRSCEPRRVQSGWSDEWFLISERERPNDRMERVGADDEIESAWQCITEGDVHTVLVLLKCRDDIAEEPLNLLIKLPMKQIDEVAAKDLDLRDEALSPKSVCRHGGADPTARI